MLWTADGDPRAAIVYLAHLSDDERQFVVTLMLSKLITWMRTQPGSGDLRVLVYMDEVFGFAPPTAAPPAKKPILTILKQARAFGVGMLLATQNPVDLDYKAMSNACTWCIGRLQTERDKARILEALQSARGDTDVAALDELISGLGKRQFVLHNTREKAPAVFTTRWAMSYLAGPLTRDQLGALTGQDPRRAAARAAPKPPATPDDESIVAPAVAAGVAARYCDPGARWLEEAGADPKGTALSAALAVRVRLTFDDRASGLDHTEEWEAVYHPIADPFDPAGAVPVDHDPRDFVDTAPPGATYVLPEAPIDTKRFFSDAARAVADHLYRNRTVAVLRNAELHLYSRVGESRDAFRERCETAAADRADEEAAKIRDRFEGRLDTVRERIEDARMNVDHAEAELADTRQEEILEGAGTLIGVLFGGRKSTRTITSNRSQTKRAERKLQTAERKLTDTVEDLEELEADLLDEITEIDARWRAAVGEIDEIEVGLERSDIELEDPVLVWLPVAG